MLGVAGAAFAADGTWTNLTGGIWGTADNWSAGAMADGLDSTANFNTLDLVGDIQVSLAAAQTVGTLVFGDTAIGTAGGWFLNHNGDAANTLVVTNVTVNALGADKTATIGAILVGGGMLSKNGAGTLTLTNSSTYTGGTTINAGRLQVGNGGSSGKLGSGAIVNNGTLAYIFDGNATNSLPSGTGISGNGSLVVTGGVIQINGNISLGGTQRYGQVGSVSIYKGLELVATESTLTGSAIAMYGDVGKRGSDGNRLNLDTSAAQGPIDLNISLGRNGTWYVPVSFTANAGTGTISVVGTGINNSGWRATPVTLTGAVIIPSNVVSDANVTINATANSTVSGTLSGGMSLTKRGSGTLTLSGINTYTGATMVSNGILQVAMPVFSEAARHFDASSLGLTNGASVTTWSDLSVNGAHATVPSGNAAPTYISDAGMGTGLGALSFLKNGGPANSQALRFTRDINIRSVFSVFKGKSFLLTDLTYYNFHRLTDTNSVDPLFDPSYAANDLKTGSAYINGVKINPTTYAMPTNQHNGYNLVETLSAGTAVTADSFNKDRTSHAGDQSHAEVYIFDTVLSEGKRLQVEAYLNQKWFGIGNGAGNVLPSGTAMTLAGNATLDLSGEQQQTFSSLASVAGTTGSAVYLGNAKLTVSNTVNTTFAGVISGSGGSLVKQGNGTLTLSGTNSYGGPTVIAGGVLKISFVSLNNPVPGATRWFDASSLALTNGSAVTQLNDLSGNSAHAVNATGTFVPSYTANAVGELGAVHCSRTNGATRGDYLNFNVTTNIRTVFSVFKGSSFLLADSTPQGYGETYHFHRPTDNDPTSPLWASNAGWASDSIKYGSTYVNGALVNGLTYAMPTNTHSGFNLVEVLTTNNVTASSFNNDRSVIHSGDQYHGEVILYDFLLTETQRLQVEDYLVKKWFLGISRNGGLPSLSPVSIMNGGTLDLTSVTNPAIGSLSATDGLGSRVLLGSNTVLNLGGNNASTVFDGVISGGGSLAKNGSGTLTLSGTNTYIGVTTLTSGTLALCVNGALNVSSNIVLAGGTLNPGTTTNALQRLSVTGAATIALGDGSCKLTFADSGSAIWTGALTLTGTLGPTTLRFGTSRNGLTLAQLNSLTVGKQKFRLDSQGYLFRLREGTLLSIF